MLPKSYRLRKKEVERTYKKVKIINFSNLIVRYFPNRAQHARFALVIPKKVIAKATARNRQKRLIFDYLEKNPALWQNKNFDIMLSFKRELGDRITEAINQIMEKIV